MNIKNPLAAALLMLASTSMAQLTLTPSPPLGTGSLSKPSPLSLTSPFSTAVPDDASFNCSTLYNMNWLSSPLVFCTPEQERARTSFLGMCPFMNTACNSYMQRIMLPKDFNPAEAQGEIDASKAANAPEAAKPIEAASAADAYPLPGQPGFMGPVQGPPAPDPATEAQDKKAVEKARQEIGQDGIKDVVDLGNGNIAKMREDGTAEVCGRSSECAKPVPASALKNPIINKWVEKEANAAYAGADQPAVNFSGKSAPTPATTGGSQTGSDSQSSPSTEARNLGIAASAFAPPPGSSGMRGASAGDTAGANSYGTAASARDVVKVDPAEVKRQAALGSTFRGSIAAENNLGVISGEVPSLLNDGAKKQAIEDVTTTIADPSKHRGGIQAEANSAP